MTRILHKSHEIFPKGSCVFSFQGIFSSINNESDTIFFFLRKLGRVLELVDLRSSQKQMEQPRNSGEMTPLHALVDVGYTWT